MAWLCAGVTAKVGDQNKKSTTGVAPSAILAARAPRRRAPARRMPRKSTRRCLQTYGARHSEGRGRADGGREMCCAGVIAGRESVLTWHRPPFWQPEPLAGGLQHNTCLARARVVAFGRTERNAVREEGGRMMVVENEPVLPCLVSKQSRFDHVIYPLSSRPAKISLS